ncbi:PH domain-containing protein [Gilvimarinus algae]|uniref:PH domain-containing protein n=1 Tax=Gilvimarinus algae TaxID=3058037 RepID=A0ABT8TE19_9GAMM|nr:PH domain-containing protein [Gilvimarinus sp. SDUM040014]MDO3382185.1 PH domain-containing protein [Gilvimarinus sp. SDUM040014]
MTASNWQRVSPVATVYFALKGIPHLVNLWPLLIPALAGGEAFRSVLLVYAVPVLLLLVLVGTFLQYWFFSYRIEDGRLQLRSGVLNRKRLTLDFERVQQADIAHPFYFRPFNLATLGLESAGSAQQEVDIPGISVATAESLRQRVLEVQAHKQDDASAQVSPAGADYRLALSTGDIARYGLMQNTLLYLAPLAAPFGQQLGPLLESSVASLEHSPIYSLFLWLSDQVAVSVAVVMAVFAVIVGSGVLFGLSVLLALVRYWGYELTRVGDRFQYRAGLTTVRTRGFREHKLQKVTIVQGVIARLLSRHTVHISKAGGLVAQQGMPAQQRFIIPVLDLLNLVLLRGELNLSRAQWQPVHAVFWLWPLILWAVFLLAMCLVAMWWLSGWVWLSLSLLPLLYLIGRRRWHCMGYFVDERWLAVRTGFIGFSEQWLPSAKIQKIEVSQSPLLRSLGLAHVRVWSADGAVTVPCIAKARADELRDQLLADVVTYELPWL